MGPFIFILFFSVPAHSTKLYPLDRGVSSGRYASRASIFWVAIRALFLIALLIASGTASAEVRIAFALANSPTVASYAPPAAHTKRDDADIRITRSGVGKYSVVLGSLISNGGNVQISAHGPESNTCQVESWRGAKAQVRCFDATGRPSNSQFSVLAVRAQNDASVAYVLAIKPTGTNFVPAAAHTKSLTPVRIRRNSPGRYSVSFAPRILSAGGNILSTEANVQVTAYGPNPLRCGVIGWGIGSVEIVCTDFSGRLQDGSFSLLAVKGKLKHLFAFTRANEPDSADYVPSPAYTFVPGASPRVQRAGVGTYIVTLNGPIGNIQTTAYTSPGSSCHPQSWDSTTVNVICFDSRGEPINSQFTILSTLTPRAGSLPVPGRDEAIDLTVALEGIPAILRPGDSLGAGARAVARNVARGVAPGSRMGQRGYVIDVVLSRDETVPDGFATFQETFREDVLLRRGPASNTSDLAAGASAAFDIENDTIPRDTPPGDYFLCARIDPGSVVPEANETNNLSCRPVNVQAATTTSACEGVGVTTRVENVTHLGSLPTGMSVSWPTPSSIKMHVHIRTIKDFQNLYESPDKSGKRFYFHVNINHEVLVDASDVDIIIMPGVKLRNIVLAPTVQRVKISSHGVDPGSRGEVGKISAVRTLPGSGYITDVLIDNIALNSERSLCLDPNECFGITLRGVRRVAIVNSLVNSLVYPVWADSATDNSAIAQNEDIIIANNRMHSVEGIQATVRMHDSVETVTVHNRLQNGGDSGPWRHNYRIHGIPSRGGALYAYAACNLLVNSGVMIGEGGTSSGEPEEVRHYWFNNNQFHQRDNSLYQMSPSAVHDVEIRGNRAYSLVPWHLKDLRCIYCPEPRPVGWVIMDNVLLTPYISPPE